MPLPLSHFKVGHRTHISSAGASFIGVATNVLLRMTLDKGARSESYNSKKLMVSRAQGHIAVSLDPGVPLVTSRPYPFSLMSPPVTLSLKIPCVRV